MSYAKKRIENDIFSVTPMPSAAALSDYYAQKYYQQSDGQKTTYDSVYTDDELKYKKLESQMTLQGMRENMPTGLDHPRLLELGCGEGFLVQEAMRQGYDIKGVDFSSFGVEKWNPDALSNCEFGNVYDFLDRDIAQQKKYDVCILRNVLEHVIDPPALLTQIKNILSDTGIALITVPNDYSDIQKLAMDRKMIDREFWFCPPDHLYYFNTKNFTPYVETHGFEVVDIFSSFPVDFFLFHSGSNYIADRTKGKEAHFARIAIDLLIAEQGMEKFVALYRAMAACGIGRDFTAVLRKR